MFYGVLDTQRLLAKAIFLEAVQLLDSLDQKQPRMNPKGIEEATTKEGHADNKQ